jgi:TetR/AcrR family transcriptional regulator, regulator of mycofactocin system
MTSSEPTLVEQLRDRRSEMMVYELERVALRLFQARGFSTVTVDDISSEAQISVRTFYRYFPTKDEVVLVRIKRKARILEQVLAQRPMDENPLSSIRIASELAASQEDPVLVKQWIATAKASPAVTQSVLGCIHVHTQPVLADFLRSRLALPADSLTPTMLAAAVGGIVQEAYGHWFANDGDLGETISRGLKALEEAMGGLSFPVSDAPV